MAGTGTGMRFIGLPARNLLQRPLRSGLTLLGIVAAVASFIALVGASRGVQSAWTRSFAESDTHIIALRKSAVDLLSATIEENTADDLRRVPGVAAVAGELVDLVDIEPDTSLLAAGLDPRGYLWKSTALCEGAMPGTDRPNGVVLGEAAATVLRKHVGDTLVIEDSEFRVTGIARYHGSLNNSVLVMPLPALQRLMGLPGKVTSFSIRVADPGDVERVGELKAHLNREFPLLAFSETRDVADTVRSMRFLRSMAWAVSFIALFMGTVAVLNTLLMSVTERTYDIGVLCALGWQPARVLGMILLEGVLLTAAGSAVGIGVGVAVLRLLARMPPVLGFLEPEVTTRLLVEVATATVLMGVAGSLYPSWRAIRLRPVDALRGQ
jgi:putative ABC transport system permease protein